MTAPGTTYVVSLTTDQVDENGNRRTYEVDLGEYERLLELGVIVNAPAAPTPVDLFDQEIGALFADADSATRAQARAALGIPALETGVAARIPIPGADPNADRIIFWDDSASAFAYLTASTGLVVSGTSMTVRAATETATGIAEIATAAEAATGTDNTRTVTPAGLKPLLDAKASVAYADGLAKALRMPRRQSLPGLAGRPTAYGGTAPTITLSAANAASSLPSATFYGVGVGMDAWIIPGHLSVLGAELAWGLEGPSASTTSSVVPADGSSFQPYRIGGITDAPKVEFTARGIGMAYRIWVDGHPVTLAPSFLPTGGAFYNIIVDFAGVRKVRRVELEIDTGRFYAMVVSAGDLVMPAPIAGVRGVILGDSFTEGSGADTRLTAWGQTFGQLCGWGEIVAAGSGGTGYLADGLSGRQDFRSRFDATVTVHNPDVVVIAGGRNDLGSFTVPQITAEVGLLLTHARAALPNAQLVVTSPIPANDGEVTSMGAANTAIKATVEAAGAIYLDVVAQPYITGSAATLTSGDNVHPSQLGHDALALALFGRYAAQLTV